MRKGETIAKIGTGEALIQLRACSSNCPFVEPQEGDDGKLQGAIVAFHSTFGGPPGFRDASAFSEQYGYYFQGNCCQWDCNGANGNAGWCFTKKIE